MFATKVLRAAAHAERTPLIKFVGQHTIPKSIDHTPRVHPASPSSTLPDSFKSANSFSSYRQKSQQHGPLGRTAFSTESGIGGMSGHALGPVEPVEGEFFDRNQLPARFHRTLYTPEEIDAIETGGATLVC